MMETALKATREEDFSSFVGGIIDNTLPLKEDRVSNPLGSICLDFFLTSICAKIFPPSFSRVDDIIVAIIIR